MGNPETDCEALIAHLYLFVDREIEGEECAALQRHIDACPDCLHSVQFEVAVKEIVRRKCSESSLPDGLLDRLRARLHRD